MFLLKTFLLAIKYILKHETNMFITILIPKPDSALELHGISNQLEISGIRKSS
jgi:hypothetical protein